MFNCFVVAHVHKSIGFYRACASSLLGGAQVNGRESGMLLRVVLIISVVIVSVGCAHVGTDNADRAKTQTETVSAKTHDEPAEKEQPVETSALDSRLLFSLLGGELAGQRGDVSLASELYADAAEYSRDPQVALRATQIALYNKNMPAAKQSVGVLLESGEVSAQTHSLALTVYLRADDVDKSLEQVDSLLSKSDIPRRNSILAVGDIVARHARKEVAIDVMNAIVDTNSAEAGAYLARSQIMSSFNLVEQAEKDAEKTTSLDSTWEAGYVRWTQVLDAKGERERALAVLKESSERLDARQLIMIYGQLLAKNEQYADAKDQFLIAIDNAPDYAKARFALGLVYLKLDEVGSAKESFKYLYENDAYKSESAFYLGRIYYIEKDYSSALVWFGKVDEGAAGYIDSQMSVAMIYAEEGGVQAARAVFQRLRNRFPQQSTRFYLLEAELLLGDRQRQALYELMTDAVNDTPDDLTLRYTRSIAATEVNELAVAEQDLLVILEKEPNNVNALNALGYTLASKTFRFKEAREYLIQAVALKPDDAAILDSMGWLNYREGHYEQALAYLMKAYKLMPDGEIAAHLGEALWMLGRQTEAKALWSDALKKDGANVYLLEVLKKYK